MTCIVYAHPDCARHVTPPGHPERVERLAAVEAGLAGLAVERRYCPMGDEADVLRCHPARYLARVKDALPEAGWAQLDGDTFLSPGSFDAAMRAVGGICAAVDAVVTGAARTAFVACRPPGHHAERETAMGFCLFGTVAIGAQRALDHHGLSRVAIVDFDVHHGNGTQDLLWDEARCLFASSHQMPFYPGTGRVAERGAHGQMLNVPLRAGSGGAEMRAAYERLVFPALEAWQPELLLISAGFDAHADDPLAGLEWQAEDYAWLTGRLCDFAGGRVVSTLEGGYDLSALAASVAAHVRVLEERGR
ncbi:MAG: histone deacetylase family protein [Tabrizicola sp.]|uniref:histone deacetylase family protein n=1 Tax=Tabrizicola sp. TaxID=2005166 RepID=UPI00273335BC|nr:histone deacetylase family protein [Tabrizicola sp.]MDP3261542.1 histone deacetylase family protein [Tabrizicola sp.]MDP3648389.1 histone deacetylase family protein [Paracoccaceae bacterium]MDZ4065375.1 histone deacetylase family protein [Tabrizicola sp.]